MPAITFSVQLDEAEAALSALVRRMDERRGFYKNVAQLLHDSSLENFRRQSAPDGTPWEPLKPATIRWRTRRGQLPIEILSSNTKGKHGTSLRGSISQASDNDSASVGVVDRDPVRKYAAIHQFGGTIPIPARPYIGVSPGDEQEILFLAQDWLGFA